MPTLAPTEQRITAVCLMILTGLALSAAMNLFSPVLLPFVLALLLSYCIAPLIEVQTKHLRFSRPAAIVVTILLACVALFLVGLLITAAASEVRENSEAYAKSISELAERVAASPILDKLGIESDDLPATLLSGLSDAATGAVRQTVSGIMTVVSNGMLVLIFMIFMIAGRQRGSAPGSVLYEIESRTKRYILTMVFISSITGTLVGSTLWLLGIPFAWMFGFLAFLLNFIPNVGSVIATLLPLPVVLLTEGISPTTRVFAVVIPSAIQFVIGSLLQPKIMGRSLDLHPVVVLLSLIFFGIIWGIVGMFLATPLIAITKILLERFEYTRSVGALLGGHLGRLTEDPASHPPPGADPPASVDLV